MVDLKDFIRYAMSAYDNPHCVTIDEFKRDVKKFNKLNKLLTKYDGDVTDVTVTLNHILMLCNVFDVERCVKMMFFKVDEDNWDKLKTYLVFLNMMPETIFEMGLYSSNIPIRQDIANILRGI